MTFNLGGIFQIKGTIFLYRFKNIAKNIDFRCYRTNEKYLEVASRQIEHKYNILCTSIIL